MRFDTDCKHNSIYIVAAETTFFHQEYSPNVSITPLKITLCPTCSQQLVNHGFSFIPSFVFSSTQYKTVECNHNNPKKMLCSSKH